MEVPGHQEINAGRRHIDRRDLNGGPPRAQLCSVMGCDKGVMIDDHGVLILPYPCGVRLCRECYRESDGICPSCEVQHNQDDDTNSESECRFSLRQWKWNRQRRSLTTKRQIPASVLIPYRMLILLRLFALIFFLVWRVKHPNKDAVWLWGMSVVCEIWFAFSWLLDQLPKLRPVRRSTNLRELKKRFEAQGIHNPTRKSDLPGIDVFVSTADPEKEPPLVTSNTILSILAADYPVDKLACYVSDDGGALLTYEALEVAAKFAATWVPFCRKHKIEPRNPENYFNVKSDPYRKKVNPDFVRDRRKVKREYDEYKVQINRLPDTIAWRSDSLHAEEEKKAMEAHRRKFSRVGSDDIGEPAKIPKATWMADKTHWPGTWINSGPQHSRGDHEGIVRVILNSPIDVPRYGSSEEDSTPCDFSGVDVRLPLLVYMSREKRPGYDHNKKAGAMNALVRSSGVMSNGPFILNLDCDHYIYNSKALREGICFMMDKGGEKLCYVQFPQRFEGIDPSDRYANHNTVFFDGNMRALDGLQGPVYVGTGCMFRRFALYGFEPPSFSECCDCFNVCDLFSSFWKTSEDSSNSEDSRPLTMPDPQDDDLKRVLTPKVFGNSDVFLESIPAAEYLGRPLTTSKRFGRRPGACINPWKRVDDSSVKEAVTVVSCWFEEKTEWGQRIGWIYGSVTEDVVTGYRMHNRGWKSVYCVTKPDAFRGTAPINLTDRLHQVLRWATGSVEIFFSRNNGLFASSRMKFLQRFAYLNVGIYPFTSIFLIVYCFLPALCLFTGQFITSNLSATFLGYLLAITLTLCLLAILEVKWAGITLEEWWRNEQFWLIGGTSAHLVAVLQGILKVIAGIEIKFTLTSKSGADDEADEFAELYVVKWTSLMIPPLTIIMTNLIAICVGFSRTIYSTVPQWSKLLGGVFFSFWVLMHLYPFAKGLTGRTRRIPTIAFIWSGLISITISLLWVAIKPPSGEVNDQLPRGHNQFP